MRQSVIRRGSAITHSLTPNILKTHNQSRLEQYNPINLPVPKKYPHQYKKTNFTNIYSQRSRKHRMAEEKNTEIEKSNRMLFEKIRKIMQKSERKIQPQYEAEQRNQKFSTQLKPLSLPNIGPDSPGRKSILMTTQSQLTTILDNRRTFVDSYFKDIDNVRERLKEKPQQLGNFVCGDWKLRVYLINDGNFVVIKGKKGKKQLTKKYVWEKVHAKMEGTIQQWAIGKFQFQV